MGVRETDKNSDEGKFVSFRIDDRDYAVEIQKIVEIIYYRAATPFPQSPDFIEGVVDLRGMVIPILDLKKRLKIASSTSTPPNHILITRIKDTIVGVVVDEVNQVLKIRESQIQAPPNTVSESGLKYLRGVAKLNDRLIFLLSVDSLMTVNEHSRLKGQPA